MNMSTIGAQVTEMADQLRLTEYVTSTNIKTENVLTACLMGEEGGNPRYRLCIQTRLA